MRWMRAAIAVAVVALTLFGLAGCSAGNRALDGTQWRLTGWMLSSQTPTAYSVTAAFSDGQVSGNSGVNSYGGLYETGPGDRFSVGEIAGTLMAGPEPAMRAESAYLELLGEAATYEVDDGTLTLFNAGGYESLIFEAVSD